jgi:hypothetical protein
LDETLDVGLWFFGFGDLGNVMWCWGVNLIIGSVEHGDVAEVGADEV